MIRYIDIFEDEVRPWIPGIFDELDSIVDALEEEGFDIIVRDTDHTYDSLRIYVSPVKETADTLRSAFNKTRELNELLEHTCCQCGSHENVKIQPYDEEASWWYANVVCPHCKGTPSFFLT